MPGVFKNIESNAIERGQDTLKTGFIDIDRMTGGFYKGDLIIIASRPEMGKTSLALNMIANIGIKHQKSICLFSIEDDNTDIMLRLLSIRANIGLSMPMQNDINLTGLEFQQFSLVTSEFKNSKIFIDDSDILSINEIRSSVKKLLKKSSMDIVFIDYLQLIKVSDNNKNLRDSRVETEFILSSLKELAKELNIPIIVLAQLKRTFNFDEYQLDDLKTSGIYEQNADVIMLLHREGHYNKDTEKNGEAELIIAKNQNGLTGNIKLAYISKFNKFADLKYY